MSEDYSFEDKMKSLLDEEREHRYEPDQWRRLSRRLKESDRAPVVWWQPWMPYGFMLLVGLLGWQLWQQQGLQRTVVELSEQLIAIESKTQSSVVEKNQTVVIYDTVYRQTIIERVAEKHSAGAARNVISNNFGLRVGGMAKAYPLFFPVQVTTEQDLTLAIDDFTSVARQGLQQYQTELDGRRAEQLRLEQAARGPHFITAILVTNAALKLPIKDPVFPTISAPAASLYQLPRAPLWQRIKPQGYTVSVGAGRFKSWAYYGNDDGDLFGDLNFEAFLGRRLSLEIGAAYLNRKFERNEPEMTPDDLPVTMPLDSDDELENITGQLQQLQFPIGLRYYAWQSGRIKFHVGLGLVPLMDLASSSIRYEYEDNDDELYTLSAPGVLPSGIRLGGAYGRFGLQAGVGKRWQLGVSATAMQTFGTYDFAYQRPSWGRWQLGVGYRL